MNIVAAQRSDETTYGVNVVTTLTGAGSLVQSVVVIVNCNSETLSVAKYYHIQSR